MTDPIAPDELATMRTVHLAGAPWFRASRDCVRLLNEIDRLHAVIERVQAARFDPDVAREEDEILAATGGGWHDFGRKTDG